MYGKAYLTWKQTTKCVAAMQKALKTVEEEYEPEIVDAARRELAVQASNGTLSTADLLSINNVADLPVRNTSQFCNDINIGRRDESSACSNDERIWHLGVRLVWSEIGLETSSFIRLRTKLSVLVLHLDILADAMILKSTLLTLMLLSRDTLLPSLF